MVEHLNGKELLADPSSLLLHGVDKGEHCWVVEASGSGAAACPDCGELSSARHSSYWRHLKDLPLQGRAVQMKLRVGRWRCRNAGCERKIFCQRLASVTHKHAVETNIIGVASLNPGIFQASIFVHLAANGAGWRLALRRLLSSGTELEVKFFKGLSAGIRTKWPNIGDFDDPAFLATVGV